MTAKRFSFELSLAGLAFLALVVRVAYVVAQPATDPDAMGALLDGAYYIQWGQSLAAGSATQTGAYYLAPLYAWLLGAFFTIFGDNIAWLYLLQHVTLVSVAALLAVVTRDLAGEVAGLATAALLLLYHPALFFASRPLGEPVAMLLLVIAIWCLMRKPPVAWAAAGVAVALSALARPNFLLVIAAWSILGLVVLLRQRGSSDAKDLSRRRRAGFALALAGVFVVLGPVIVRNWRASGHLVPISANSGMTLFHGNGPGAKGIGVLPPGFSGLVSQQRQEATQLASQQVGRALDDVEADRWWGRQAVQARMADPIDSLMLQLRRTGLLISNRELDLDYAPSIDANPWRRATPLPFALLIGLAAGALIASGPRRSGGWIVWTAVIACAATPLLFYVSSRYRLPTALLLAVPAGIGVAQILSSRGRRRLILLSVIGTVTLVSVLLPTQQVARTARAIALANRGTSWKQIGDLARAEQDMQDALATDPNSAPALFSLGILLAQQGRPAEAEEHYRRALSIRPSFVEAAQNLSSLMIGDGRAQEAVALLIPAVAIRPDHSGCWKNLIVAHYLSGAADEAQRTVDRAQRSGAILEADWLAGVARAYSGRSPDNPTPEAVGKETEEE